MAVAASMIDVSNRAARGAAFDMPA